jgi:hypothetical protein
MLNELKKAGMNTIGQVFTMKYNGPFTPWFMRRNEVAVEVECSPSKSRLSTKHV